MDEKRILLAILEQLRLTTDNNQAWHGFRELAAGENTDQFGDEGGYYAIFSAYGGDVVYDTSESTVVNGDTPAGDITISNGSVPILGNWSKVASDATSTGTMWVYIRDPRSARTGNVKKGN